MKVKLLFVFLVIFTACSKKAEQPSTDIPAENPNIFSTEIGAYKFHLLSEGQNEGKTEILIGATPEMIKEYAPNGKYSTAVNTFLIQTPDKNILIDTGFGKELTQNLQSLGLEESDITDILLTHMHGDHIGGLLKGEDPRFPNAYLKVSIPEYEYWDKEDAENKAIRMARMYPRLSAFSPEIFAPGNESGYTLVQGVKLTAIPAYGHTPGHVGFLLETVDEKILIWGDIAHAMAFQMPYPDVAVTYDTDPDEAIQSRKALLEYVADNNILIAGMHIPYPGMGYIKKTEDKGYEFIPL
ncbi:MAG: MBL fold metallo-hydrolase [Bacteroidales bacterium]|nr:MBL fold metallo-hydrolase [Bacteroidales bacterium]